MKQKIKIMKNQPQLSDEEVQRYMDFENLLSKRKVALDRRRAYAILKWSLATVISSAVIAWLIFLKEPDRRAVINEGTLNDIPLKSSSIPPTTKDSLPEVKEHRGEISEGSPQKIQKSERLKNVRPFEKEEIYIQAEPPNGYPVLYEFLNANLVYPPEALADSIQGVQTISFIINTNGTPEKITITNSLGEAFEKEARRLIENMPAWKPATFNGKPVASKVSLPLTFQIQQIKN